MSKQYTVTKAYTDNSKISYYENGKKINYDVISDWKVDGYRRALESMGYTRAYDVELYKEIMDKKREEYEASKADYEEACKYRLEKEKTLDELINDAHNECDKDEGVGIVDNEFEK